MKKKIKCNSCDTEFETFDMSELYKDFICIQADNCASYVYFDINEIRASCGSRYDTGVYEFINGEVPDWIEHKIICDVCIKKLIDAGQIRLKRINDYR